MGATETLARFAVETELSAVPEGVIESAKRNVLDTLAVMIGGSQEECTRIAVEFVKELGARQEATVIGHDVRSTVPYAAFANGVSAHALRYDDTWVSSTNRVATHISVCVLPAALAIAEARGAHGRDLLLAYILGYEVVARVGMGLIEAKLAKPRGWHSVPVLGPFGAAIAAAKLLGLRLEQTRWALGIAGSEAGGLRKNAETMTKPFHAGHAARNGVVAALLAAKGYEANPDILEVGPPGPNHDHFGFCEAFAGAGNYDTDAMVRDLGTHWELPFTTTKRYPVTVYAAPIDLTLGIVAEHDIRPADVQRIELGVGPRFDIGPTERPFRFSLPYGIAVAVLDRRAGLAQFAADRAREPDVEHFLKKVHVYRDTEYEEAYQRGEDSFGTSSTVTFWLNDGRRISRTDTTTKYLDQRPDWDSLARKFRECAEYTKLAPAVHSDRVISMARELEQCGSVSSLVRALTPLA